ncbi:MAG: hypothetical protein LBN21_00260 [Treponema sp.]|jgi:hypothetical protein|nr:hypothetical protein [Treponema sp.]
MKKLSKIFILFGMILVSCNFDGLNSGNNSFSKDVENTGPGINDIQVYFNDTTYIVVGPDERTIPYDGNGIINLYFQMKDDVVGGLQGPGQFKKYGTVGQVKKGKLSFTLPAGIPDEYLVDIMEAKNPLIDVYTPIAWYLRNHITPAGLRIGLLDFRVIALFPAEGKFEYINSCRHWGKIFYANMDGDSYDEITSYKKGWNFLLIHSEPDYNTYEYLTDINEFIEKDAMWKLITSKFHSIPYNPFAVQE